jgi:two-component system sensor histidine kinase YesM
MTQLASFSSYAAQVIDNAIANATLRAREDAEYRALQAQIQPHFMYNVLNGFVALNRMGARPALELSLHAFKDMLRYTIDHGRWSSVREEFAFLERYCHLQKLRFEEKFSYLFELEPDAADLNIPKLIVQPLLENAFVHGIEPSMRPCRAKVSGKIDSGALVLEVEDDGIGCDPAAIRDPGRIGIVNVRERLALLYSSSDLELSSSPGSGFKARIAIPVAELDRAFNREDRLEDSN